MIKFPLVKLSHIIFITLFLSVFSFLFCYSIVAYSLLRSTLTSYIMEQLDQSIITTRRLVETATQISIKSYLRALTEQNVAQLKGLEKEMQNRRISRQDAQRAARELLVSQHIGPSGYFYVIDSTGTVLVHPKPKMSGIDLRNREFIKSMTEQKHGLLHYRWKNPDEPREREKIIYYTSYEPWDWIIAASAYRDELWQILILDDFIETKIASVRSDHELVFLITTDTGNVVLPRKHGTATALAPDLSELISEIRAKKNGTVRYFFPATPGGPPVEHVVLFSTIDEYGLIAVAATAFDHHFMPLQSMGRSLLLIFFIGLAGITLISLFLSRWITKPLRKLLTQIDTGNAPQHVTDRQEKNEIAALSNQIRAIIATMKQTNLNLEEALEEQRRLSGELAVYQKIFETSADGMVITNAKGLIEKINPAFEQITGYSSEEALGQNPRILKSGQHSEEFYRDMWTSINESGYWSGKILNKNKAGKIYPELLTISAISDAQNTNLHYAAIFSDLSQIIEHEEQVRFLAFHDPLTSLPNRLLVLDRIQQTLSACKRHGEESVCMIIDLDNFKTINDSLGHDSGDEILIQFANRIAAEIREEDTLGRVGGDEFIYAHRNTRLGGASVISLIDRFFHAIEKPFQIDHQQVYLSMSIGIAVFPHDGETAEDLLKRADLALLKARGQAGNSYQFFSIDMEIAVKKKLHYLATIRDGLTKQEFVPFYQPKISLRSGQPVGVEALARWCTDTKIISPAEFIEIAEQTGSMPEIAKQIYTRAFRDLRSLHEHGHQLTLAVNLSPSQLRTETFAEAIQELLQSAGLDSRFIEFEITENILMETVGLMSDTLNRFVHSGFSIAIDDFGTGYSSLSYLKKLPLNTLKIDRSFVSGINLNASDEQLVRTIVLLARQFGLSIVAEGIENQVQERFLIDLGCDYGQGYLYGKPMAFEVLIEWLGQHPGPSVADALG